MDYLRGLAAFGIMTYHYSSWSFGEQEASSFLGRVGIYGVAIFYVLSGLTLSYIYRTKLQLTSTSLYIFYKKRLFRIFPLLWVATILSILLSKRLPNPVDLFLNLTGLFGLIKWDIYFATGAWSIGNELVFYLTFPLLIFLLLNHKPGLFLVALIAITAYIYFAFHAINLNIPLSKQWHTYTNPLNQFLFFGGGVILGSIRKPGSVTTTQSLLLGAIGLIIFLLVPVYGNAVTLVTGMTRVFFTVSCLLLCYSFYRTAHAPAIFDKPLALLGQASYSLYLLHPIVYSIVKAGFSFISKKGGNYPAAYAFSMAVIVSLITSYLSYQYFERFFIRLSHNHPNVDAADQVRK
ncbi:acyltransferase family protein [Hymenobacter terricola]|uniref:acyltransferase family protein n=1 Tax=Hymenobacter terricola TaxID=2819236 RepID=UPI0021D4557F|nr:acyltransferase [Hymenobacter terricola]